MLVLDHCNFAYTSHGCVTWFHDGAKIESFPHDIPHYYVVAHRCGYGDDLLAYCRDHDFLHNFCEQFFYDRPSRVLRALAHGREDDNSQYEEMVVQTCQRWIRSNERPIIGGVDWDRFKTDALGYIDIVETEYKKDE